MTDIYLDPPVGTVAAEPLPTVTSVPQPNLSEVTPMPDVTKEDLLAILVAVLATATSFGVDLSTEQIASLTALATALVVILPLAGAKRRKARVPLVMQREAEASSTQITR